MIKYGIKIIDAPTYPSDVGKWAGEWLDINEAHRKLVDCYRNFPTHTYHVEEMYDDDMHLKVEPL